MAVATLESCERCLSLRWLVAMGAISQEVGGVIVFSEQEAAERRLLKEGLKPASPYCWPGPGLISTYMGSPVYATPRPRLWDAEPQSSGHPRVPSPTWLCWSLSASIFRWCGDWAQQGVGKLREFPPPSPRRAGLGPSGPLASQCLGPLLLLAAPAGSHNSRPSLGLYSILPGVLCSLKVKTLKRVLMDPPAIS